jgi:hypothetical protein
MTERFGMEDMIPSETLPMQQRSDLDFHSLVSLYLMLPVGAFPDLLCSANLLVLNPC